MYVIFKCAYNINNYYFLFFFSFFIFLFSFLILAAILGLAINILLNRFFVVCLNSASAKSSSTIVCFRSLLVSRPDLHSYGESMTVPI